MPNSKKKGNIGEHTFAKWLRSNGIKAFKDAASGGSIQKGDIHNDLDYSMEVKTVKALNLKKAWEQVNRDARLARNMPLLAVHFDGMRSDEWIIAISSEDWLELIQGNFEPQTDIYQDPKKKYRLKNLIESAKSVLKDYE